MLKILLVFLMSFKVYSAVILDIEITHEKGLGKKMILKSELMSRERAQNGKLITLKMKNGISLDLEVKYDDKEEVLPEGSVIEMSGILKNDHSKTIKPKSFELNVKLNSTGSVELKDEKGQKTTIALTPKEK